MGDRVETYCQAPGCDLPTKEGRRFCPRDTKRDQRRRAGRSAPPLGAPAVERLDPIEQLLDAANRWVETPAEDDAAYEANKRAVITAARKLGPTALRDAIRHGMASARARGVRIGRPRKVQPDDPMVQVLVERVGVVAAAAALRVHRTTLRRTLSEVAKGNISHPGPESRRVAKGSVSHP